MTSRIANWWNSFVDQTDVRADDFNSETSVWNAYDRSNALLHYSFEGTIERANDRFCDLLGYSRETIIGKRIDSLLYDGKNQDSCWSQICSRLGDCGVVHSEDRYQTEAGSDIWILSKFHSVLDQKGTARRVMQSLTDISERKREAASTSSWLNAINMSQAMIEFTTDGIIIDANKVFLDTLGYAREEIVGQHHSMFVDSDYSSSLEYRQFWNELGQGEYKTAEFKRRHKTGTDVWIQATYTPILDPSGGVSRVIKVASDITPKVISLRKAEIERNKRLTIGNEITSCLNEVAAAVKEISASVDRAAKLAKTATHVTEETTDKVSELGNSSKRIGQIIEIIQDLAEQTSLLALNATIEAARAGELGRGFAVVAQEVKQLAHCTNDSTTEIAKTVGAIQETIRLVVDSVNQIGVDINNVEQNTIAVASAVSDQSAMMSELSATASELLCEPQR